VRPRYGEASLIDVLPGALAVLGVPGSPDPLGLRESLAGVRRIAVLLVDGLGYHLLPVAAPGAPVLADVLAGRLGTLSELSSAFPSTTPTSLVSLGTGAVPGEHGVLGFTVRIPGTDRVLVHVDWAGDPDPAEWQPVPTQFERAAEAGIRVEVLARPGFAGSGLTESAYRGARYHPTPDDALAERMLAELTRSPGPALVYGYYPALDTASHLSGIDSPQWMAEASIVDGLVTALVDRLPADAALLVTADHGALDVPPDCRFDCGLDPRLSAGLAAVAGEPRVRYLYTRPGATADVLAAWRSVLGAAADVLTRDEAVATGWFGPVAGRNLARIGDVVVVCRDRYAVLATGYEPATVGKLVAFHGALTSVETAVPLIIHSGR
jgi:hypothetical protein